MSGRRVLPLVAAWAMVVVLAPAARASHAVRWGAGTDCASVSMSASTTVDTPVRFVVCVTRDGAPLAGHVLSVRVTGPERRVELDIETGADGVARFGVQPTAAGETTVTLCDEDGCLYGDAVLVVTDSPAPTPTTTVPPTATTVAPVATTAAPEAGDDDGAVPATSVIVAAAAAAAVAAAGGLRWWRRRRRLDVPVPPELDHALTRRDLRLLAGLDAELLREAATAAGAAPSMTIEDHLEFFLADVHHRVDVAVREQMDRIERLGPDGSIDRETVRLKQLLDARQRVSDLRQRVAVRLADAHPSQRLRG